MSDEELFLGVTNAMDDLYMHNSPFMEHEQSAYNYLRLLKKRLLEGNVVKIYNKEQFEIGIFLNVNQFINMFKENHPEIVSHTIDDLNKIIQFKNNFKFYNEYVFYFDIIKLNEINSIHYE